MSLQESKEFATVQINQLINFIKSIETNNYYDPEQFHDARKTIETVVEELSVLERKLVSSLKNEEKMGRIGMLIPANLKERLKNNAAKHDIPYTDIVLSLIEKYLKTEEQKEDK